MSKYYTDRGSFCTKVYIGTDENGKPKYKKLKAKTEKELTKKVFEFKKTLEDGVDINRSNDTLGKWITRYEASVQEQVDCGDYKESEYDMLVSRLNYFIDYNGCLLSMTRLNDVLTTDIQPAVNALFKKNPRTGKPTAKRTIERYIRALANVFEFAKKERAYKYCNPCEDLKVPKKAVQTERNAISMYMIRLILETEHRGKLAMWIMLLAGLRRGELTALTWDDIDLEKKVIDINKSYDFKECVTKDPKSKSGIRQIPINDILFEMLAKAKAEAKGSFVIEKVRGGRMSEKAWQRLLESYMLALKVKDAEIKKEQTSPKDDEVLEEFTSHQLRHTYCSMLQWSGVDIKVAQELMGHSEYEVTANVYTHNNDDSKKNAAVLQGEFLRNTFMKKEE